MTERVVVKPGSYHDSAFLMRLAHELSGIPGVSEAVVLMGTEMNRQLLSGAGFDDPALREATPMDLVLAVRAEDLEVLDTAESELDRLLQQAARGVSAAGNRRRCSGIAEAIELHPDINLVTVAVPGDYAAYVASQAIEANRHVFLFSDNVAIADEAALKERALERGLLMMGPDCGTAMLAGVGLGFMNRVRRGRIGIVGASGTGMQEIACLIHRHGQGISQAIGVGSRDLSAKIGGRMSGFGLELLARDEDTDVIVLVAKQPDQRVARKIHAILKDLGKPSVVRYLGRPSGREEDGIAYAASLDEAAARAAVVSLVESELSIEPVVQTGGCLLGLFGGGSLALEAALVLEQAGLPVEIPDSPHLDRKRHLVVDTGADFYTRGRPHPMVDQTVRCGLIETLGRDPGVGVLLFDLVLGDGAHPDPAPELVAAVKAASVPAIASVTGTELDPQNADRQIGILRAAGIQVHESAARAARAAAGMLGGRLP